MALEDIKAPGKRQCNMYRIVDRYLRASIGKRWADVYSKLCAVADAKTYRGAELRRCIGWEVDMNGPTHIRYRNDYYVDPDGLLQEFKNKRRWKSEYKAERQKLPIERIRFEDDGPNLYYELVETHDGGPASSKYSKIVYRWFRVEKSVETYTIPLDPMEVARRMIGNKEMKKGKKNWYRECTRETIHRTSVGGKLLQLLRKIALRQTKIVKLIWPAYRDEFKGLTAVVRGSSQ